MHIQTTFHKGKKGKGKKVHLLRESYREGGKVKKRTLANISSLPDHAVAILKATLKNAKAGDCFRGGEIFREVKGPSVGATLLVKQIAERLGVCDALGKSRQGSLALWQVMARVIDQGSRLSAARLGRHLKADSILRMAPFNENNLYENLDWLSERQGEIEDRLFKGRHREKQDLFLYDVTSSYLEGTENELGAFGYNRDGKKGKRQIVIGLLCDKEGIPVSVQVFPGNTQDPKTVADQVSKISTRFGGGDIVLVGDRGMLKSRQQEDLLGEGMHYITAITKPQIEKLIKENVIEMSLFDIALAEVEEEGVRYVLKKNPVRAREMKESRLDKMRRLKTKLDKKNEYLREHPGAKVLVARRELKTLLEKMKIDSWVKLSSRKRVFSVSVDQEELSEVEKLDGCYVLKTDLSSEKFDKHAVHDRYKDLAEVEWAFRTSKTTHLEVRPVFVRKESRTKGHVFVVLMAYAIIKELSEAWRDFDVTVEEGIDIFRELCVIDHYVDDIHVFSSVPELEGLPADLLKAAGHEFPKLLQLKKTKVDTKQKLAKRRN